MPAEYVWRHESSQRDVRRRPQSGLQAEANILIIEKQSKQRTSRSRRIATRLAQLYGEPCGAPAAAIILVDQPAAVMPAVKRSWLMITRQLQTQRASTLTRTRIMALDKQIERMQATEFVIGVPRTGSSKARVFFVAPKHAREALNSADKFPVD